jgi:hypothetical protein
MLGEISISLDLRYHAMKPVVIPDPVTQRWPLLRKVKVTMLMLMSLLIGSIAMSFNLTPSQAR